MEILFFLILRQKSLLFLCSFFQNTGRRTDKRIGKGTDKRIGKGTDKRTDIKNEFKNELMERICLSARLDQVLLYLHNSLRIFF